MMTILVASFSQGAEAWLRLCATTEGQWILVVTVKFFWKSLSLVSDQHGSADPSPSVLPFAVPPAVSPQSGELHVRGL